MEHEKVCFFIGHREASERVLPVLTQAVEQLIVESGVTDFVVGHYGSFDSLAAKVVKAAKKRHPDVTLTMLLPYHPFDHPIPIPKGYDSTFYPPGMEASVYKGYKRDKIEMRGDRAEMSDFPLYLNTVAGGLDRRDQTIGGFSFVVKIYAVPVVEIIG